MAILPNEPLLHNPTLFSLEKVFSQSEVVGYDIAAQGYTARWPKDLLFDFFHVGCTRTQ